MILCVCVCVCEIAQIIKRIIKHFLFPQLISLVMVSIGVYARMMKYAGKCTIECPNYVFISAVLFQSIWFCKSIHLVY